MGAKLTFDGALALMRSQPVGTDLVLCSNEGAVFRKLDTGLWHEVYSDGTVGYGWKTEAFRLDLEVLPWAFM